VSTRQTELLQGTLDMLILRVLALAPLHGVGIAERIEQVTRGTFKVGPGSLFPALHRMEERGWLKSSWGETSAGRRARFYTLTRSGRRQLETETERWKQIALAVGRALEIS
jgi:PadR family transcriptional regulator